MDSNFTIYTKMILEALPHWFKMRKESDDSLGARFLNICGLTLDNVNYVLDYAYKQCYIETADIYQADFCYKSIIAMPFKSIDIQNVKANSIILKRAETLKEFFGIDLNNVEDRVLYTKDLYYIDVDRNIIYVRQKYNADALHDNGKITVSYKNGDEQEYDLIPHQIWNYFDEFGSLLSCPRIPEESNQEYKKRILDVFKNPAGASLAGLINGIGRELSLRKEITWKNPKDDLEILTPMIVLNSIRDDNGPISFERIMISEYGSVVLKGDPDAEKETTVSYIHGLEMHQIWNKEDSIINNDLFTTDNVAKDYLKKLTIMINTVAPLFWNDFKWNEHYWNPNEKEISGTGYIPNLFDASMKGFENYEP